MTTSKGIDVRSLAPVLPSGATHQTIPVTSGFPLHGTPAQLPDKGGRESAQRVGLIKSMIHDEQYCRERAPFR